jgi:hypothetical protein
LSLRILSWNEKLPVYNPKRSQAYPTATCEGALTEVAEVSLLSIAYHSNTKVPFSVAKIVPSYSTPVICKVVGSRLNVTV